MRLRADLALAGVLVAYLAGPTLLARSRTTRSQWLAHTVRAVCHGLPYMYPT